MRAAVKAARRRRRKLFAKVLGSLLTIAGLVIGGRFLLFSSSIFALSEVVVENQDSRVQGAEGPRVPEFEEKLRKTLGKNWLFLKAQEAVRALGDDPKVKVLSVQRPFPGKVVVKVESRKPFAVLDLGPLFLVDEEGMVFAQSSPQEAETLKIPRIIGAAPVVVGEKAGDPYLLTSLFLIKAAKEKGWDLRRLWLSGETIKAVSPEGQVVFGQREFETQLERLNGAKAEVAKMGVTSTGYDLRFKDQVVVSVRDTMVQKASKLKS